MHAQPQHSSKGLAAEKALHPTIALMQQPVFQVDPGDIVMLVLSWHFRAGTMCEYSRDEFVGGMLRLRCDSLPKLRQRLPELRRDLQDPQKFKVSPTDCPV